MKNSKMLKNKENSPYVIFKRIKNAHITAGKNTGWTIDGEEGGNITEVDFEVLPKAVTVMTPEYRGKR